MSTTSSVPSSVDYNALLGGNATNPTTKNDNEAADRFLKLLVAQVQNQDPLAPMDNAQVTSQMAQINTVTGIEKLNTSVQSLSSQFLQMQTLQGASLVGRDVVVPGDELSFDGGTAQGVFELAGPADNVTVEVLSASGQVLKSISLGAQSSGMHGFEWEGSGATESSGLSFRVKATTGAVAVTATTLMADKVTSVATRDGGLTLELARSGTVDYADVRSIN